MAYHSLKQVELIVSAGWGRFRSGWIRHLKPCVNAVFFKVIKFCVFVLVCACVCTSECVCVGVCTCVYIRICAFGGQRLMSLFSFIVPYFIF